MEPSNLGKTERNAHRGRFGSIANFQRSLGQLVEAGLIHGVGSGGQERFEFKHALVRDAAYESLLMRDRRDLHAAVASAFEHRSAKGLPVEPELLAHHYTEAGAAYAFASRNT